MQTKARCMLVMLFSLIALGVYAQYDIPWHTSDAGGGASTGGTYVLSGIVGQPDTVIMTGGEYEIRGGFWSGIHLVQLAGGPQLRIAQRTANTVLLAWPAAATGYQLQATESISAPPVFWVDAPGSPEIVDDECQITVNLNWPVRFFRLYNP